MYGDKQNCRQGQYHAVEHIEAQQCVGVDLVATQQQKVNLAADERDRGRKVGPDGDGPEG
jgi:hypothetical protein